MEYLSDLWLNIFYTRAKIELLKCDLKTWNNSNLGIMDKVIEPKKLEIASLDRINDSSGLDMNEMIERKRKTAELIWALH